MLKDNGTKFFTEHETGGMMKKQQEVSLGSHSKDTGCSCSISTNSSLKKELIP